MALYLVFAQAQSDLIAPRHSDHRTAQIIRVRNLEQKYGTDKVWHLDRVFVYGYCPVCNKTEVGYDGSTMKGCFNDNLYVFGRDYTVYGAFVPEDVITWDAKHVTLRGTGVKTLEVLELIPAYAVLHIPVETEDREVVEALIKACNEGKLLKIAGRRSRGFGIIKIVSVCQVVRKKDGNVEYRVLAGIQNPWDYANHWNSILADQVIKEKLRERRERKQKLKEEVRQAQTRQKPETK